MRAASLTRPSSEHPVAHAGPVLGDRDREAVALVEEARRPVEGARRHRPVVAGERRPDRLRDGLPPLGARRGPHRAAVVDVQAEEVERLAHHVEVGGGEGRHVLSVELQALLGVAAEEDGVDPPRVVPEVARHAEGGPARRLHVGGRVARRHVRVARGSEAHAQGLLRVRAQRLHRPAVGQERVVDRQQVLGEGQLVPGGELAGEVPHPDEAPAARSASSSGSRGRRTGPRAAPRSRRTTGRSRGSASRRGGRAPAGSPSGSR